MFDMGGLKLDKKMAEQTLKEKTAKGLFWGGLNGGIQQLLNLSLGYSWLGYYLPETMV